MRKVYAGRPVMGWVVLIILFTGVLILMFVRIIQTIQNVRMASEPDNKGAATSTTLESLGLESAKLIFVSDRSGSYQIYEKTLVSGAIAALTSGSSDNMNPQLSPDGSQLVFYSNRSGSNQIYALSLANPTSVTQLTNDDGGVNDYDPVFLSSSQILYKKTDTNGDFGNIWEMNADGSNQHDLTPGLITQGIEAWKPTPVSGSEAVITERLQQRNPYSDNLYSLNVQTGVTKALTNNTLTNWFPDYNSKTGSIVFVTKQDQSLHDVLATTKLDGTDRKVLVDMPGDSNDPSWSTDNRTLIFINDNGTGYFDVYAARADGSETLRLDQGPVNTTDLSPLLIS